MQVEAGEYEFLVRGDDGYRLFFYPTIYQLQGCLGIFAAYDDSFNCIYRIAGKFRR